MTKSRNKIKILFLLVAVVFITSGCTKILKDSQNKIVVNQTTGQSLPENVLCKPTNEENIKKYQENGVDISKLPDCKNFKLTSGGYEGLWNSIFVKPLAFIILFTTKYVGSAAIGLILITIIIRLAMMPFTAKTAKQSEALKKAKPEIDRLEAKYKNQTSNDAIMKKTAEMNMIYKKYNINLFSGCLFSFIQIPLMFALLEAINRVPLLFEERFLSIDLGTSLYIGLFNNHNFIYAILLILVAVTTHFSFSAVSSPSMTFDENPMNGMGKVMTIMLTIFSVFMPAALCIYWSVTNLFTIMQNIYLKKSGEKNGI